jgi:hypothetical protein
LNLGTNLSQFNKALDKASEKIHGDFEKFYKQVCLEVLKRIVLRTPVDTGRARGNWQVEIGSPATASLIVEGAENDMANYAIENGLRVIENITSFSIVHITNNVEYVYYLEYEKRSQQHPEGMVEITLSEMAKWILIGA